jgi:glycerol uptake facilitator-like aquaporin
MNLNKILAEFFGTAVFLFVIIFTNNAWAIGLTLAVLVLLFGRLTGANFNPAVTIMFALAKKLRKSEVLPYIFAQLLGALAALQAYRVLR